MDPDVKTFGTQFNRQPDRSDDSAGASTITFSDPVVAEPTSEKINPIPPVEDVDDDVLVASPPPRPLSPGFAIQPVLAEQSGTPSVSTHPTPLVTVSHDTSRSPSQPPSIEPVPDASSEDMVIQPESTRQSREPEDLSEQLPVSETMMDVDEELLSLVEDRPVHVIPPTPKVQIQPALPSPTTGANESAEGGSNEVSDGPSLAPSSQLIPKGALLADEEKDRASMPPPAARNKKAEKDKATGSKKKKDATSKVRISDFVTRSASPYLAPSASLPLKRNKLPNHELKPFPKPKRNPMARTPLRKVAFPRASRTSMRGRVLPLSSLASSTKLSLNQTLLTVTRRMTSSTVFARHDMMRTE